MFVCLRNNIIFHLCRYVEYHGIKKLFAHYEDEVATAKMKGVAQSYFYTLWREVMNNGVLDPETGVEYTTYVRKNHCRGFAVCSTCEILSTDMARAVNEEERECYERALAEHHEEVSGQCLYYLYVYVRFFF